MTKPAGMRTVRYVGGLAVTVHLPSRRVLELIPGVTVQLLPSEVAAVADRPDFDINPEPEPEPVEATE